MTKEDRLIEAGGKITRFNYVFGKAEPFIKRYWQAIQRIWESPINKDGFLNQYRNPDYEILIEHGLCYENRYRNDKFSWNYDLSQLNNLVYKGKPK